jgi:hypothetical protein
MSTDPEREDRIERLVSATLAVCEAADLGEGVSLQSDFRAALGVTMKQFLSVYEIPPPAELLRFNGVEKLTQIERMALSDLIAQTVNVRVEVALTAVMMVMYPTIARKEIEYWARAAK